MPLFRPDADEGGGLLYAGFNQDGSALTLTDARGLRVLSLETHAPCFTADLGGLRIAEMLHTSSLLAYVGAGHVPSLTPRRLALANTARGGATIAELPFSSAVVRVCLNRARLVALTAGGVAHVHALESLEALAALPCGGGGVAALTDGLGGDRGAPGRLALAAPATTSAGQQQGQQHPSPSSGRVRVFELRDGPRTPGPGGGAGALTPSVELAAHRSPLAAAAWSADGGLLATAGARGTVIRLWSLPAGSLAASFRRGTSPARVTDLAFGPAAGGASGRPAVLAAATAHASVHLFRLGGSGNGGPGQSAALASLAPPSLAASLLPRRADAVIRLPAPTTGAIVALHRARDRLGSLVGDGGGRGVGEGGDAEDAPPQPSSAASASEASDGGGGVTACVVTAEGVLYEFGVAWGASGSGGQRRRSSGAGGGAVACVAAWAKGRSGGGGSEDGGGGATMSLERELFVGRAGVGV
jgi:autophagy-related protein 18